jgi:hypothetical protein
MKDADKTKKQLIEEISAMRQQVAEQEDKEAAYRRNKRNASASR